MFRIIRLGIAIMAVAAVIGGGSILYSRHSLASQLDATVIDIANHYSALTTAEVLPLLEHSEMTGSQRSMLHALSATAESLQQSTNVESRVRTIVDYQKQASALVASLTPEQVTLATDAHFLSFASETGERSTVRKDIEQYNNLLIRIRGVEDSGRASLLPTENAYKTLPFLRFDGPAPSHAEVTM
jgi:hypothetical protein